MLTEPKALNNTTTPSLPAVSLWYAPVVIITSTVIMQTQKAFIIGVIIAPVASLTESGCVDEACTIPDVPNPVSCDNAILRAVIHSEATKPPAIALGCIASSKIITNGFLYARKPFYGMGIYFSDMLDYVSFYSGGTDFNSRRLYFGKILPINITFTCVAAEVFYSKHKLKEIFDFSYGVKELDHFPTYEEIVKDYSEKKVQPNGVHFARIEPNKGQVRDKESIKSDQEKGKFIGTEYVITLRKEAASLYTPETVGKIEEKDYHLTSINCTLGMYYSYIKEEPHDVTVDDDYNPFEHGVGYFVPEWMFEDRQDDLVKMYKRYGKYEEK